MVDEVIIVSVNRVFDASLCPAWGFWPGRSSLQPCPATSVPWYCRSASSGKQKHWRWITREFWGFCSFPLLHQVSGSNVAVLRGRRGFPQASGKCKLCIGDQSMQMAKHNAQSTQSVSNMLKPHVCSVTSPFRFCGMLRVLAVLQRLSKTLPSLWTMNIYESCYQLCQVEVNIGWYRLGKGHAFQANSNCPTVGRLAIASLSWHTPCSGAPRSKVLANATWSAL